MLEGVDKRFPADDPERESEVADGMVEEHPSAELEITQEQEVQEHQEENEALKTEETEPEEDGPSHEEPQSATQEEDEKDEEKTETIPAAEPVRHSEGIPPATRPGLRDGHAEPVTMEQLLEEEEYVYRQPERGDVLNGIVISIGPEGMMVDVGLKREGLVPSSDLERLEKEQREELEPGMEIPVYVLRPRDRDGNMVLSVQRAKSEVDWTEAQELMESGKVWEGEISAFNQGGLVVPFNKIRGFLPASQVVGIPRRLSDDAKESRLKEMVGQTLPLKIIEVDRKRRRLIFSHRAAWWKWKEMQRTMLLDNLNEGDTRKGVVSSLRDFGAFVDLGGADGLIHVSELAWQRVKHPNEVLKVGDEIEVYVLNVDQDRKRIGLSLKRLKPEPWSIAEERFEEGQLVQGVVTRVVEFGAFVKIEEGIEGLIHKSELADVPPPRVSDLVKDGDLMLLRIIRVDARRRRIGLSLRQVTEEEWSDWAASFRSEEEKEAAPAAEEKLHEEEVPPTTEDGVVESPVAELEGEDDHEPEDTDVSDSVSEEADESADQEPEEKIETVEEQELVEQSIGED